MTLGSTSSRFAAGLAVVALVLLAGCGAVTDAPQTRSPFAVNDSEYTAREAVGNGSVLAFDADRDHAPDPDALLDGHRAALAERSYTLEATESVTRRDGTTAFREATTVRVASDHSVYEVTTIAKASDGPRGTVDRYANGTHVWERQAIGNETTVGLRTSTGRPVPPSAVNGTGSRIIMEGLSRTNVTSVVRVTDAPERVDEPVYRIRATEPSTPSATVENVSLTLTVTEPGRVLEYEYVRVRRNDTGATVTVRTAIEYESVGGTTVRRPNWVPENATRDEGADRRTAAPNRSTTSASIGGPTHPRPAAAAVGQRAESGIERSVIGG
jgi:hypothetical protein